jgi:hypothetical protein
VLPKKRFAKPPVDLGFFNGAPDFIPLTLKEPMLTNVCDLNRIKQWALAK